MRFGIVVYEDVEPIDIGATYGVLSMARRIEPSIEMFLVAARAGAVRLLAGLEMVAHHGFADCPPADAFIVTVLWAGSARRPTRPCSSFFAACRARRVSWRRSARER